MQRWSLAELHRGLLDTAFTLGGTGKALYLVADAPLGESARRFADDVTAAAGQVRSGALAARDALRGVALGVGTAIGVLGLLPVTQEFATICHTVAAAVRDHGQRGPTTATDGPESALGTAPGKPNADSITRLAAKSRMSPPVPSFANPAGGTQVRRLVQAGGPVRVEPFVARVAL